MHLAKYEQNNITLENINEIVSQGISARYNGDGYYIGKPDETTEASVVLNKNSKIIAKIYLTHQLKEDAKNTIRTLQQNSYQVII
jgi:cation transport ATPase